jgi:hypothetical protein
MKNFFKKYSRKIWISFLSIYLISIGLYILNEPILWQQFKDTWHYIPIIFIGGIVIIYVILYLVWKYLEKPMSDRIRESWRESIRESMEETSKLNSDEIPSDDDILKYYKMYCKKLEIDNTDQWTTEEPMSYENFEKRAKKPKPESEDKTIFVERRGWEFLIAMTSDAFMFNPKTGQHTMMRFRKYN